MKVYGLRIGTAGVEFSTRKERDGALAVFTAAPSVLISDSGLKYRDGETTFATYERETKTNVATCCQCKDELPSTDCPSRPYLYRDYNGSWREGTGHVCDPCLDGGRKDRVKEAQEVIDKWGATAGD